MTDATTVMMRAAQCGQCGQLTGRLVEAANEMQRTRLSSRPFDPEPCSECKVGLPPTWTYNGTNYTGQRDGEFHGDPDEDGTDERPRCLSCDSMEFTVLYSIAASGTANSEDNSFDDYSLYVNYEYDLANIDIGISSIECSPCGATYQGDWAN